MKIEAKAVEALLSGSLILNGVDLEAGDRELRSEERRVGKECRL